MPEFSHFIGKICTVSTVEINFKFKFEQMNDYFVGVVVDIDRDYIWLEHHQTKALSAIARKYMVNIAEEQVLIPDTPEKMKLVEQYHVEKPITATKNVMTPEPLAEPPKPTQFINPSALAELMQKAKRS